jgi:putative ABC transport system substrate-binding protein
MRRRDFITLLGGAAVAWPLSLGAQQPAMPVIGFLSSVSFGRSAGDPIELGLVASLARPGGNLTGVTTLGVELGPKRLELLHNLVPPTTPIALLVNPTNSNSEAIVRDLRATARSLGRQIQVLHASNERDFDPVLASLAQQRGSLVIANDGLFARAVDRLASLTVRHAVPAIHFQTREFTAAGGLMGYGGRQGDAYHLAGVYTGRILRGEKPADLPVQQATKVELIINLKTAKALGLAVPLPLLGRADEVIE